MANPTTVGVAWGAGDSADHASFAIPARTIGATNNLILAFAEVRSAAATNFTALVPTDGSNTYHLLYGVAPSTATYASCYWALAAGTGPYTITWTPSASGTVASQCREITGNDTTTPVDQSAFTNGTSVSGTPFAPTSLTSSFANELAVGAVHWLGSTGTAPLSAQTFSTGSGQVNDTPVSATNAHNCSVGLSEINLATAGALTFTGTLGANAAYACGLVTVTGTRGVTPPTSLKNPSLGMIQRGATAPASSSAAFVHGSIIECHWGAQSSQGDSLNNAAQPDVGMPTGGWGQTIAPAFVNTMNNQLKAVRQYNALASNVRTITGAVITSSNLLASASLTSADIGKYVSGPGLLIGTYITVYAGGISYELSQNPSAQGSGLTIQVGQPQTLRLRVETGIHSPNWVYALGGGALTVHSGSSGVGQVPQWWKTPVLNAYANLISGLANCVLTPGVGASTTVDLCPEIRECLVGLSMLFFGECFIRFPTSGSPTNSAVLLGAGLTSQIDYTSMTSALAIHGAAFLNTLTMADVNQYQNLVGESPAPPANRKGIAFTQGIMDYMNANLAGWSITNASFDSSSNNGSLYSIMANYGPKGTGDPTRNNNAAISFQTYPNSGPAGTGQQYGTLTTLLTRAATYGANSIEIPASSQLPSGFTQATYQPLDAAIEAQQPESPSYWPWTSSSTGTTILLAVHDQSTSSERVMLTIIGPQEMFVMDQSTSTEVITLLAIFGVPYVVSKTILAGTAQPTPFKPF